MGRSWLPVGPGPGPFLCGASTFSRVCRTDSEVTVGVNANVNVSDSIRQPFKLFKVDPPSCPKGPEQTGMEFRTEQSRTLHLNQSVLCFISCNVT